MPNKTGVQLIERTYFPDYFTGTRSSSSRNQLTTTLILSARQRGFCGLNHEKTAAVRRNIVWEDSTWIERDSTFKECPG